MASKELSILLLAKDMASKTIGNVNKEIAKLGKTGAIVGQGMRRLGANLAKIAVVGGTALVAYLGIAVKEGQDALKVQQVYAKAIENSGNMAKTLKDELAGAIEEQAAAKPGSALWNRLADNIDKVKAKMAVMGPVTAEYTAILNAQQTALMDLAGVDDELIKTEQTRLIQMGLNGKAVSELTPLIMDVSKATGKDLLAVTVAVGKAVNGNVGGLSRYGVIIDKVRAKTDPYGATLDALKSKYEGVTQSMSGNFDTAMGRFRAHMGNITEDVGIKMLPALTRIIDAVSKSLLPAFQKFIDRIMPDVTSGLDEFAKALEGGGAERAINGIGDALGSVIDLLKLASGPVKMIVGAFLSLPKELQTIAVGAFAINKLSGGMLTQLGGEFFKRGGTPANPLFVADVAGGLGGKGGVGGVGPAAGGLGMLAKGALLAEAAVAAAAVYAVYQDQSSKLNVGATRLQGQTASFVGGASSSDLRNSLNGLLQYQRQLNGDLLASVASTIFPQGRDALADSIAQIQAKLDETATAVTAASSEFNIPPQRLSSQAEGVLRRAVARGLDPSQRAVQHTLERNLVRTSEAAAASRKTAVAVGIAERARSIQQSVANAQLMIIAAKTGTPIVNVSTGFNVAISVRDTIVRTAVRRSYGTIASGGRVGIS